MYNLLVSLLNSLSHRFFDSTLQKFMVRIWETYNMQYIGNYICKSYIINVCKFNLAIYLVLVYGPAMVKGILDRRSQQHSSWT